jgi:RNA polymerase sigma-70 factor, ECF subfamily
MEMDALPNRLDVAVASELAYASELDFPALYEAEFTHVWHTLRRFGVQDRDLEDLCHDVFVAFYGARDRYDQSRPLRPWLTGIAFRIASDYRRRAGHRRELSGQTVDSPSTDPRADDMLSARQEQDLVIGALATMEEDRRAVLVMHDLDGHSMPVIAEALGLLLNTAYSRLRLARVDFATEVRRRQQVRR